MSDPSITGFPIQGRRVTAAAEKLVRGVEMSDPEQAAIRAAVGAMGSTAQSVLDQFLLMTYQQKLQIREILLEAGLAVTAENVLSVLAGWTYADTPGQLLTIETFNDGSKDHNAIHPSVIYFPEPWNGYQWWMAHTPYDGITDIHENPWIVVSSDGVTWNTPPGGTNPIQDLRVEDTHYADTDLAYDPLTGRLYCFWYVNAGGSVFRVDYKYSTDGINWSDRLVLHTGEFQIISPSVVKLPDGSWGMWWVTSAFTVKFWKAATLADMQSNHVEQDVVIDPLISYPRHLEARIFQGTYYLLLANNEVNTDGSQFSIVLASGTDGINFTFPGNQAPIIGWDGAYQGVSAGYYRSSMVFHEDFATEANPKRVGKLFAANRRWLDMRIANLETNPDSQLASDHLLDGITRAIASEATYVVGDNFDRADGSIVGTNATSGATWLTSGTGVSAHVVSNQMVPDPAEAALSSFATLQSGSRDHEVVCRFSKLAWINSFIEIQVRSNLHFNSRRIGLYKTTSSNVGLWQVRSVDGTSTITHGAWRWPKIGPEVDGDWDLAGLEIAVRVQGDVFSVFMGGRRMFQMTMSAELEAALFDYSRVTIAMKNDVAINKLLVRTI